ncbi:MAPEG family protein [Yoonia sp.]|uniref:MAPEG family protein n=1 Tax=Yoonia sp. TaxID=2212373 RepID=UPI0039765307
MTSLPVTSVTAVFAGVLILLLTIKVIQLRRRGGVILGDNDDHALTKAIRGHANAAEQLPIALIIMGLAELQGGNTPLLLLSALSLMVGRVMHGVYFAVHGTHWRLPMYGMMLTLIAQGLLVLTLALTVLF